MPVSGRMPEAAIPPTVAETARPGKPITMTVRLASALAAKIRRGERTATSRWRQVPSRSSEENTSPAMIEVTSGSSQLPAKLSAASGAASPVACSQRPYRVSDGSVCSRAIA